MLGFHMSNTVVTAFTPIIKFLPHTPLQPLSMSIVRCCRVTTCLFCVVPPSACLRPTLCVLIVMPPFPPCPSLPTYPPQSLSLWQLLVHFWVLWVYCCFVPSVFALFLYSTDEWNHLVLVFLYLAYFTECNTLQRHPCCCKWQGLFSSYGWKIFHSVYVPHLLYPFIYWWTPMLLPFLGYCK